MSDGFVVVCEDDGILFGQGATVKEALGDAREWIEEAVRSQVSAEMPFAEAHGGVVSVDMTWRTYPATTALRDSIGKRGGHDDWHKRQDGVLDLGRSKGVAA